MILLTVALNFTVNYLLILGCGGLCRSVPGLGRALLGAAVGAVHAALCLVPGLEFLGHFFWRLLSVPLIGVVAFGNLRQIVVLSVLCLGADGVLSDSGIRRTLIGLSMVVLLWAIVRKKDQQLVPVELKYGGKLLRLKALRDTGNCLRDPMTGRGVMVIGADAAGELTGLTAQQLRTPLETMGAIPGLRLIPYKTVGSSGFLLALKLPQVRIGNWKGGYTVAFAPEGLEGTDAWSGGSV